MTNGVPHKSCGTYLIAEYRSAYQAPLYRPNTIEYQKKRFAETFAGMKLVCEFQIAKDKEVIRRARLRRSFGFDFSTSGEETRVPVDD